MTIARIGLEVKVKVKGQRGRSDLDPLSRAVFLVVHSSGAIKEIGPVCVFTCRELITFDLDL